MSHTHPEGVWTQSEREREREGSYCSYLKFALQSVISFFLPPLFLFFCVRVCELFRLGRKAKMPPLDVRYCLLFHCRLMPSLSRRVRRVSVDFYGHWLVPLTLSLRLRLRLPLQRQHTNIAGMQQHLATPFRESAPLDPPGPPVMAHLHYTRVNQAIGMAACSTNSIGQQQALFAFLNASFGEIFPSRNAALEIARGILSPPECRGIYPRYTINNT